MVNKNLETYLGAYIYKIMDCSSSRELAGATTDFTRREQMQSAVAQLPCFLNVCSSCYQLDLVAEGIFESCLCSSF